MKKKAFIKPWMGSLGLLGFLGLFYFTFNEPFFLAFFGFFGGFSFYWEGKLAKELQDERMDGNRQRASKIAMTIGFSAVFIGMILIGNIWGSEDPARAYVVLNALIAFAFAVSLNLSAYLAYKFDRGEQ